MEPLLVNLCGGTACIVMDGSQLALLEEHLPPRLRGRVRVRGERCLGLCQIQGAAQGPFVTIAGAPLDHATLERVAARILALLGEEA